MAKSLISFGARREGRTPTLSPEPDFESGASASSAIRACPQPHREILNRCVSSMPPSEGQSGSMPCKGSVRGLDAEVTDDREYDVWSRTPLRLG